MASVEEVKAGIAAANSNLEEAQGLLRSVTEKLGEVATAYAAVMEGGNHELVGATHAAIQGAVESVEQALAGTAAAMESAQNYAAGI